MARRPHDPDQLDLFPEEPSPPRQSPLLLPRTPKPEVPAAPHHGTRGALEESIARLVPGGGVSVRYTNNETVILSLHQDRQGRPVLRAHECFRQAPPEIADAAVRLYLKPSRNADRRHNTHLVTCWHHEAAPSPPSFPPDALDPGMHHELRAVLDGVNQTWFHGELDLDITFGRRVARHTMGRHERRRPRSAIIINPLLDHPWITRWYLDYLVFHECLHEVIPPRPVRGRMVLHPPELRRRERQHPDLARAREYEKWLTGSAFDELQAAAQRTMRSKVARTTTPTRTATALRSLPGQGSRGVFSP